MAALVSKSDSQNRESDVFVHKRLPKMCPFYPLSELTVHLSDYTLQTEVGVFCLRISIPYAA